MAKLVLESAKADEAAGAAEGIDTEEEEEFAEAAVNWIKEESNELPLKFEPPADEERLPLADAAAAIVPEVPS